MSSMLQASVAHNRDYMASLGDHIWVIGRLSA